MGRVRRIVIATLACAAWCACAPSLETPESRYEATVRARAALERGETGRAAGLLEDVAKASREAVDWSNLGLVRSIERKSEAAERAWKKAVAVDGACARAHFGLGVLWREHGRELLARARTDTRKRDKLEEQAKALLVESAHAFESAAAADPSEPVTQQLLALVREDLGDAKAAARAQAEARRLDPAGLATLETSGFATIALPPRPHTSTTGHIPLRFAAEVVGDSAAGLGVVDLGPEARADLVLFGSRRTLHAAVASDSRTWTGRDLFAGDPVVACARADLDGDGRTDAVLFTLGEAPEAPPASSSSGSPAPTRTTRAWWLRAGGGEPSLAAVLPAELVAVQVVDLERDGDVDLLLATCSTPGLHVWRGTGGGRLDTEGVVGGLDRLPPLSGLACADLNGDVRPDIVCADRAGKLRVLVQRPTGGFADQSAVAGLAAERARALAAADVDGDGRVDLLVGNDQGLWVYANRGAARFARAAAYRAPQTTYYAASMPGVPVGAIHVLDFDNDGAEDVVTLHPHVVDGLGATLAGAPGKGHDATPAEDTAPEPPLAPFALPSGLRFWRNDGRGVLIESSDALGVGADTLLAVPPVSGDFDRDGDLDLACVRADSSIAVAWNEGGHANRRVTLELEGGRGTRDAIGARVEIYLGTLVIGRDVTELPLVLGMQSRRRADVVRVRWPDGAIDTRLDVEIPEAGVLRLARADSRR